MTVQRITSQMISSQVLANVNSSEAAMDETANQLSSGKRINQPSDDPYGAGLAVQLNGQLSQLSEYSDNVNDGTAWTQAGLSALSSMTDQLQRAQELVETAANGTENGTDLSAIASELSQLVSGIRSAANSQYDGQYIFSGTSAPTTAPYADDNSYQGGTGAVTRTVGAGQSVAVNTDISSVLSSSGSSTGLLDQLQTIVTQLGSGDSSQLSSELTGLQTGLAGLTTASTTLGAAQNQLSLASTRITDLQSSVTGTLNDDVAVNMATAMTNYSNQQAAFEAALKAGASIVQTSLMDFLSSS